MSTCIFAGPTLPQRDEARSFDATWLPPAKHGDVYRAVSLLRPRAIGIVDGYFQWVPSVWHKEILWAIQQGVHVFGAASMGALRAAELAPFGMRGVGRIFQAYRTGVLARCGDEPFEDDDEVAVVHGPPESGYLAASEAMVNIRYTLAEAERAAVIDSVTRAHLTTLAKAMFFPERNYECLLERARSAALPAAQLAALQAWLPAGRVNLKRTDAVAMIEAMREFLASDPPPARAGFDFEFTTLWDSAVEALRPATVHQGDEVDVLDELRLDGGRFRALRQEVLNDLFASGENAESGKTPGAQPAAEHKLEELAKKHAVMRVMSEIPAALIERQMIARLRSTGDFEALLMRAQAKRTWIASHARLPHVSEFSELQLLQLRDWYFSESSSGDMPDDLERYVSDAGYADISLFHAAIFTEYVYRRQAEGASAAGDETGNTAG